MRISLAFWGLALAALALPVGGADAPRPGVPGREALPPPNGQQAARLFPGDDKMPALPECAGIPTDEPFYDLKGLAGSFAGTLPAGEAQPLRISFAVLRSAPYAPTEGVFNGVFVANGATPMPRFGNFRALPLNPAIYPGIWLQSQPGNWEPVYIILGLQQSAATGLISSLCLYDARHPWPPTVFPRRPFALHRITG
ncbi:hypothetical protein OOT46_17945 [Aquabacterium sp. A7-Y]|uniref:hypothetical protein n=1 Tax=Aquabacterium sp. A7-Y TaxID=1349605 RepID=UPI00223D4CC1|nr:hypothetical protein [Aquabacterium sp. A7-Y]MCW7539723.1 hypothetical protein [Aquabacterium sp. A7-Y]